MVLNRKLTAALLTVLSLLLLLIFIPSRTWAEAPIEEWNRYNVVLVVDKSGSLICENDHGTDPDGLRYEALKLFLGLLTERGNNVGAVVFDEHIRYEAALEPLEGMEAKKALIQEIEKYTPYDDTDIGKAMLRATELLREMQEKELQRNEKQLPGMIILFSDGMTDFVTGDVVNRRRISYENAQKALDTAKENEITINGILLNVDDAAERGKYEFQVYTYGTNGEFEEVRQPEDLTNAFRRLYQMINKTEYTGTRRVSLSDQGEAEIHFAVPGFGVEEVNVIVESSTLYNEDGEDNVGIEVIRPDGSSFDIANHDLNSSVYKFVKLPEMAPGIWTVRLKGEPDTMADITMVCNATLSAALREDKPVDSYRTNMSYPFKADVAVSFDDPAAPELTADQLGALQVVLVREELATGAVREYRMDYKDGSYTINDHGVDTVNFPRGGDYALRVLVDLGEFKKTSNTMLINVTPEPPIAQVDIISDMVQFGHFRDGIWELELPELFGIGEGSEVEYTPSDDYNGLVRVEGDTLRVEPEERVQQFSFTLTAKDQMDQSDVIAFELVVPLVYAKTSLVDDILEQGAFRDPEWEIALSELFEDPKGLPLTYMLSDDFNSTVTIENGMLCAKLKDEQPLSFTLTATDQLKQSARVTFDLSIPTVTAKLSQITNMMQIGSLRDFQWELPLDGFFSDPKGLPLEYEVSDDYNGAVTIDKNVLRVDFSELREVKFDLSASNTLGRRAVVPVSIKVPAPAATVSEITETVKTGLFQENIWERNLSALFRDPKGTKLSYRLSDDFGGAAKIENGSLIVNMKGLKKAHFSVIATDEYGLNSEISVALAEKNMTVIYSLWALLALLLTCGPIGAFIYMRKRNN